MSRPPCTSTAGWLNAFSLDCAAYETRGWCASGAVRNDSASGPLFAMPEVHCCACSMDVASKRPPVKHGSRVHQLVFLASHVVDASVTTTLAGLTHDLQRMPSPHLPVLLLFQSEQQQLSLPDSTTVEHWRSLGTEVCPWSLAQIFQLFPRLEGAFRSSRRVALAQADYLQHYFLFHTSLALWLHLYGHAYPWLRHLWRVEPDVALVGHGGWTALLMRAGKLSTDVLLPHLTSESMSDASYDTHWQLNRGFTHHVPREQRAWSLVSVGRYSRAFLLDIMWPQWEAGVLAYEEIFLPTSCLAHRGNCTIRDFGSLVDARHVRYRPNWNCAPLLQQLVSGVKDLALWHPVKDADCTSRIHKQARVRNVDWRPFQPLPPPSPPALPPSPPKGHSAATFVFSNTRERPLFEVVRSASLHVRVGTSAEPGRVRSNEKWKQRLRSASGVD